MMVPHSSTEVTSDSVVKAASGYLVSVLLTAGSAAATIVLYDNASAASGTVLATLKTSAANISVQWSPAQPIAFQNGIYADITGASATAYVAYG